MKTYFKSGSWNVNCDRCGFEYKAEELRDEWTGLKVCSRCWEPRHEQTLIKVPKDDPSVPWQRTSVIPTTLATFIAPESLISPPTAPPPASSSPTAITNLAAAQFNGTTTFLSKGSALSGLIDSSKVTVSLWIANDMLGTNERIVSIGAGPFDITHNLTNTFSINAVGTSVTLLGISSSPYTTTGVWTHVLASVDLASTSSRHLYINGVSDLATVTAYVNDVILFSSATDAVIGARVNHSTKFKGGLAQVAIWPGSYIDLSIQSNRDKFITSTGHPVDFISTSSGPLGVPAIIYQNIFAGDSATVFATNKGTGGGFTINGSLSLYPTSPI